MSEHYHDENDLKLMRDMRKLAPDDFNAQNLIAMHGTRQEQDRPRFAAAQDGGRNARRAGPSRRRRG